MNKKKKPRYSVLQNTVYLLEKWWKDDKKNLLIAFSRVPALVLIAFIGIILPRTVIDCLSRDVEPWYLVTVVGLMTLTLCILHGLERFSGGKMFGIGLQNRVALMREALWKCLNTDYENIESAEGQHKQQKAFSLLNSNSSGGEAVIHAITTMATDFVGLILYGLILAVLHPIVILVLVLLSIIVLLVTQAVERYVFRQRDVEAKYFQKLGYLFDKPSDFQAGKDIRLYKIADWFSDLFHENLNAVVLSQKKIQWRWFGVGGLQGVLNFLRDALAYGYLVVMVLEQRISIADFTMYFGAVTGFSIWMSELITQISILIHASLECCEFRDFIEMPDKKDMDNAETASIDTQVPSRVEFEHVSFCYPGAAIQTINNISFDVKPGEKIALVGINGAGKTTCIKLLCGLYYPTSGHIRINGVDVRQMNRSEYMKFFSVVFQENNYFPFSIAQNIATCRKEEIDYGRVDNCLELAGIRERVNELPNGVNSLMNKEINPDAVDFSGGELQKIMLARALYKDAPIIVLDEPTAALDPIAENELYQKYSELTKGRTSFFISHRLSSTRFCDRIFFLSGGCITEVGTHDELMELDGGYAHMYEVQSHYYKTHLKEGEYIV